LFSADFFLLFFIIVIIVTLFIQELKKFTSESHPDFEGIPKAASRIEQVLLELNKNIKKGEQEELKKVQTIYESVEGDVHVNFSLYFFLPLCDNPKTFNFLFLLFSFFFFVLFQVGG